MVQEPYPSIYDPRCEPRVLSKGSRIVAQLLPPEEVFSYFAKFDELCGSMICPDVRLLSRKDACHQPIDEIFDEEWKRRQRGHVKRIGVRK